MSPTASADSPSTSNNGSSVQSPPAPTPSTTTSCQSPAAPRGQIAEVYAPPTGADVTSTAVLGGTLYIGGVTSAAAEPWLKKCSLADCAATVVDVELPAALQSAPPSGGPPSSTVGARVQAAQDGGAFLFGAGSELFYIAEDGAEPVLLGSSTLAPFVASVRGTREALLVGGRPYHNHGDYREVALVAPGSPSANAPFEGGEIFGNVAFATPTRLFVVSDSMYGGDVSLLDPTTNTTNAYLAGDHYPSPSVSTPLSGRAFAFGERVGAIEQVVDSNGGPKIVRTAVCDSDATCSSPIRFAAPLLPNDPGAYAGVFGDELVFWVSGSAPAGTIASCTKTQLLTGPCVPSVVACDAPRPRYGLFGGTGDGTSVFYTTDAGHIVRVTL
jgi:hypothetical protein